MEYHSLMAGSSFEGSKIDELKFVVRSFIALVLVVAFTHTFQLMDPKIANSGGFFALGFLLLAGTAGGRIASFFALPQLTGFLIAGLLVGPSVFEILTYPQIKKLDLLNTLAIALISLQAGSALSSDIIKNYFKSLAISSLTHFVIITLGMMAIFYFTADMIGIPPVEMPVLLSLGFLWGVMCVAKSPAAVVAIISESKAKGPLATHGIGMVVITSILVLVCFSVALLFIKAGMDPYAPSVGGQLNRFLSDLVASIAAGTTIGLIIIFYYWMVERETLLFLILLTYGVSAFTNFFNYDTMLVFVMAGIVVANISNQGQKVVQTVDSVSSVVMIVFFALAGAKLHLEELNQIGTIVLIMVVARILFTWIAEVTADKLVTRPSNLKVWGFSPSVAQAGLTFGLAILLSEKLPSIGPAIATLAITVGAINEIIGPIVFKLGLQRTNEVNQ